MVQVGDFGLFPSQCPETDVPVYWIEGNHEPWSHVAPLMDAVDRVITYSRNCHYVRRGTLLTVDGVRILCAGGADSVDAQRQQRYGRWSAREQWSPEDFSCVLHAPACDIIVTHSPPQSVIEQHFDRQDLVDYFGLPSTWTSAVAQYVEHVWSARTRPPLYCGHMHRSVREGNTYILNSGEVVLL